MTTTTPHVCTRCTCQPNAAHCKDNCDRAQQQGIPPMDPEEVVGAALSRNGGRTWEGTWHRTSCPLTGCEGCAPGAPGVLVDPLLPTPPGGEGGSESLAHPEVVDSRGSRPSPPDPSPPIVGGGWDTFGPAAARRASWRGPDAETPPGAGAATPRPGPAPLRSLVGRADAVDGMRIRSGLEPTRVPVVMDDRVVGRAVTGEDGWTRFDLEVDGRAGLVTLVYQGGRWSVSPVSSR